MRADESDEAALMAYATALADAIDLVLPRWVERSVERVRTDAGHPLDPELRRATTAAGQRCRDEVGPAVRSLLLTDADEQRSTPLAVLRAAVRYPTEVLAGAGIPAVERDEFQVRAHPDDRYSLAPASFADVDESLAEPGLVWGAAKAHVHLARRSAEGRR
ncbi:MAG: hypothetical protein ACK4V6_08720 [Microthrixaceae bacterium]